MKRLFMIFILSAILGSAWATPYSWYDIAILGKDIFNADTQGVNVPGFSNPYGVAVDGNGKVWTSSYYGRERYQAAIIVYDPFTHAIDTVGPEIEYNGEPDTIGYCRFMKRLGNGNIAYGDLSNDRITIFDKDDHRVVARSDSAYPANVSGGIEAFVYDEKQYYLSQRVTKDEIVIWNEDICPIDTLKGGGGGRNLACTYNGSVIISPSLVKDYFVEFRGSPDDGYDMDTIRYADIGIEMSGLCYVSAGPNDYIWLFSRENDAGIYVVDPMNSYDIKLFTNTDSTVSYLDFFSLGMAMESQYKIWLAQHLVDSSDVYTPLGYYQPWVLRSPSQVDYYYREGVEILYISEFYGYSLNCWIRFAERPFTTSASNYTCSPGDTAHVRVRAMFPCSTEFTSFNMKLSGFQEALPLLSVTPGTDLVAKSWQLDHINTDTVLYVSANGTDPIGDWHELFWLNFLVPDSMSEQRVPIHFEEILYDSTRYIFLVNHGSVTIADETKINIIPEEYRLGQNYPNPFNPRTSIDFELPRDSDVDLSIFDIRGRKICDLLSGRRLAGRYKIIWDASGLSSGIYVYQLKAGNYIKTRKMLLMK